MQEEEKPTLYLVFFELSTIYSEARVVTNHLINKNVDMSRLHH